MCLIIHKKQEQLLSADYIRDVWEKNNDGWGVVAFNQDGSLSVQRGMIENDLLQYCADNMGKELAIHFRMATHGTTNLDNCHPFLIAPDTYMMHNGIFGNAPDFGDAKTASDTNRVAKYIIAPLLEGRDAGLTVRTPEFKALVEMLCGTSNRVLIADTLGVVTFCDSLWQCTTDGVKISNGYAAATMKEANGVKPPPVTKTWYNGYADKNNSKPGHYLNAFGEWVPYGTPYSQQYNDASVNPRLPLTANKELNERDKQVADLKADIHEVSIKSMEDFHYLIESYPALNLNNSFRAFIGGATPTEINEVMIELYQYYLLKEHPGVYDQYCYMQKGTRYIGRQKIASKIKPKTLQHKGDSNGTNNQEGGAAA